MRNFTNFEANLRPFEAKLCSQGCEFSCFVRIFFFFEVEGTAQNMSPVINLFFYFAKDMHLRGEIAHFLGQKYALWEETFFLDDNSPLGGSL